MSRFLRVSQLAVLCVFLFACATPGKRPSIGGESWSQRQSELNALEKWSLRGRIVVTLPDDAGKGRLRWAQDKDVIEMSFRGPFGAGGFQVKGTLSNLTLTTKAGESYLSENPEADLARELGWQVPLTSLGYWVRGLPDPSVEPDTLKLDDGALLRELNQSGWLIDYQTYREFEGTVLPRKLVLTGGDVTLKLVTDRWTLTD
ncbi:MAG: lipoprotein insertase outer membrane protein LolB [Pseudomonadota bacterium]